MKDEEIIARYHTEVRNKALFRKYIQYRNEKRWDEFFAMMNEKGLTDPTEMMTAINIQPEGDYAKIRRMQLSAYNRFTQFFNAFEQKHGLGIPIAHNSVEKITQTDAKKVTIALHQNRTMEIVNLLADGDIVQGNVLVYDTDISSGKKIMFEAQQYLKFTDGIVTGHAFIPNNLPSLLQIVELTMKEDSQKYMDYINQLREMGLVSPS